MHQDMVRCSALPQAQERQTQMAVAQAEEAEKAALLALEQAEQEALERARKEALDKVSAILPVSRTCEGEVGRRSSRGVRGV